MIELTQDVVDHGASVAAGGERLFGETGNFWAPTVQIDVPPWPEMPFGGVKELGYGSEEGPRRWTLSKYTISFDSQRLNIRDVRERQTISAEVG